MRNPFTQLAKFFAPMVGVVKNMFGKTPAKKQEVVRFKDAMSKKDKVAQVTFWKKVMKRRMKKGRAVKNPTRKYKKALAL